MISIKKYFLKLPVAAALLLFFTNSVFAQPNCNLGEIFQESG